MTFSINIWHWNSTDAGVRARIMRRSEADIKDVADAVKPIIEDVKRNGDTALISYADKFDKADLRNNSIRVSDKEFARARKNIDPQLRQAIEVCVANVRRFHEIQKNRITLRWAEEVSPGVWAGEQTSPISSVGLYVPRGKGSFPSVMYMLATPAVVAGVERVIICTPPTADGTVDDVSLVVAEICGVKDIYKAGGAQAIAAMALGTQTVPKVDKVVGPGNAYVMAARRLLGDILDSGMPAGPSEAIILADESADVCNTALDLLNEAEHGADSASILVTPSSAFAHAVADIIPDMIEKLPTQRQEYCKKVLTNYGGIVIASDIDEAIAFCNEYAVEHLLVKVANPSFVIPRIVNAGEILVGENTPIALGNFGVGVNAVLPTGGHARTWSATTIRDFMKVTTLAWCSADGLHSLQNHVEQLANYEGFTAHARAITERNIRIQEKDNPLPV